MALGKNDLTPLCLTLITQGWKERLLGALRRQLGTQRWLAAA